MIDFEMHNSACAFYWVTPTSTIPANTWTFVVGTYDGTTMREYINGVQVGTLAGAFTPSILTTTGGYNIDQEEGEYFPGLINDVRVYNRALSATQIAAMYNGGK